jgi:hypothetical protein
MISDLDLCRDIAEFAHFAIALRGGLPQGDPQPKGKAARPLLPPPLPLPLRRATPPAEGELPELAERRGCLAKFFRR